MNFVVATACIKMTPEEAINAATINGAYAMGLFASHGSITIGKGKSYFDYSNSFLLPTSLRLWQ
jgi:imidazolonepropionase